MKEQSQHVRDGHSEADERPKQRRERRWFFRYAVGATMLGILVVATIGAAYPSATDGATLAGVITVALMAALLLGGVIWLARYIFIGNRRPNARTRD